MTGLRDAIRTAAQRIAGRVRTTPVLPVQAGDADLPCAAVLKLECLQHAGSFKPRGAFNRILSAEVPAGGVIAASGGNHGLAVAYAARTLGLRTEIFVPRVSSPVKVARIRELGATVHVTGADYAEARAAMLARHEVSGALDVHAYDQVEVVAGQGTVALELEAQCANLDTLLVAVGGGGLIAGISGWYEGRIRVVGVEPETSCAVHAALAAGGPVDVPVSGVAADSLGARRTGDITYPLIARHVDRVVLVTDAAIVEAQHALWREFRIVAEPGGAAAFAALRAGRYVPAPGERVGVLVCGGNCDPASVAG